MEDSKRTRINPEADESKDVVRFDKSLQELKDLRSQLHLAADYCESRFSNAEEKRMVVDNTKEYICKAMVTVVDHLGNVSANLNCCLSNACEFSSTELRIDCLKQRLVLCEGYVNKLALTGVQWNAVLPRHNPRYLLTSVKNVETSKEVRRDSENQTPEVGENQELKTEEGLPLFLCTHTNKPSLAKNLTAQADGRKTDANAIIVPVRNGLSILSKSLNPTFHFQGAPKLGRNAPIRKSAHSSDILSLIRRVRQTA
ncbi:probable protein ABIL1 [Rhodamnia argentea]|uniref:Probable protein ABIL1 n=1 Tax=Rhodamnia argentea TaxID=178133 RepID=A0A8B8P5E8_9MYRT|nr:probable protein ABIL1 [Rhodamnia argentea]